MSGIEKSVDDLEYKINKILQKLDHLKTKNDQLVIQIEKSDNKIIALQQDIANWKDKYESLKFANTILSGSNDNNDKRETKLKINTLIRDIDHCITQLSK